MGKVEKNPIEILCSFSQLLGENKSFKPYDTNLMFFKKYKT